MEAEKLSCPGCGTSFQPSWFIKNTRRGICGFCGMERIFKKRSEKNVDDILNACKAAFVENNFETAKGKAEELLSINATNLAALYVIAFYNAFISSVKSRMLLDSLFKKELPSKVTANVGSNAEMEQEEENLFKELLLMTITHSSKYLGDIIDNFVKCDNENEIAKFIEDYCPVAFNKSTDVSWFTPRLKNDLIEVTRKVDIRKTWYALLSGISKNPDSPLLTDEFYLKTKSKNFYVSYVLPVGEVLENIQNETLKKKFQAAYIKTKSNFESKLQQ